jgi:hypothetical protein
VWPGGKANRPLLGFPLPLHGRVPRVEGEGGRAAAPRRWEKERARHRRDAPVEGGAEGRTGGKDIFTAKERRAAPEEGGRAPARVTEQGPRRRPPERTTTSPSHASPPSRPRLHHRPIVSTAAPFSLLPLVSLSCDAPRRRDATSWVLAWLLAVAPQDCRTAAEGAPEPPVLLGAAVAVRGRVVGPAVEPCSLVQDRWCAGLRAERFVQERERRRVAARRALVTRRPRRADRHGCARLV